jgi:hypothetical protein
MMVMDEPPLYSTPEISSSTRRRSSNKKSLTQSLPAEENYIFSKETFRALQEYGNILRKIHMRLLSEGYTIRDGQIFKEKAGLIQNDETNHHRQPDDKGDIGG